MDATLLECMGFHPKLIGAAELQNFKIAIGNKATLIPNPGSICYGVVMDLPDEEAMALYSNPDVSDYRPEIVNVVLLHNGTKQPSSCYNLPSEKIGTVMNRDYADKLSALVLKLGFPSAYARQIKRRPSDA
jgi:hypothetical protein